MRQDDSAVVAIATHADVAAVSVAVVVLAAAGIVASLLGVAAVVAADLSLDGVGISVDLLPHRRMNRKA